MESATAKRTDFLWGNTEMTQRIRGFDWSKTPLGPLEEWSPSLKSVVGLMLANRFPMLLWWGEDYIQLYNDPYIPVTGLKHPQRSFGVPGYEGWSEIWHILKPLIDSPFRGGPATWMEDITLVINRNNFTEETHFTIAYSPVPDDTAPRGIGGILATVTEITETIIGRRQMETLRDLGKSIPATSSEEEVYARTLEVLASNPLDIPSASLYKLDENGAAADAPQMMQENIHVAAEQRTIVVYPASPGRDPLPKGAWDVMPAFYVCVPVRASKSQSPVAVLVAGLNPYRKFDDSYRNFFQLIADQVSLGLNNAFAYEEERKRARALEELDRSKTIFFSNISHEFRTPLTLMLGTIEELLKESGIPSEENERLRVAHRNALRLLKLVNTLLDFSRIESGRQKAAFALTDIAGLTRNLAGNFRSVIEKAGLEFSVKAEPPADAVYIDRDMWEKIVFNLLSNAFKYTLKGGIYVELYTDKNCMVLEVRDTGTGIPENELPHMFDRFHRVENSRGRSFEGTGIGLSLIKELVQLHGGDIGIQSTDGKGTTVMVTIPFGKDHLPPEQICESAGEWEDHSGAYIAEAGALLETAQRPPQEENGGQQQGTVLVVDDNADMRHHIRSLLHQYFHVVTASDGKEALEKIDAVLPDLVLSDIMMPVMDGLQLLKTLRKNKRTARLPVIFLTARAGEDSRVEGYETGADDYLVKPFSANELLSRVRAQISIGRKRAAVENRLKGFLMQSPAAIAVLEGPEHIYTIANAKYQKLFARREQQLIGYALKETYPEVGGQGIYELFDRVFSTGEAYTANDLPASFNEDGIERTGYFDFVIHPIKDEKGLVTDLIIYAHETTAQVMARRQIEESERRLEAEVTKRTFELKEMNKELESFNYIASHDLQEPLRKIQTFILLLEERRNEPGAWQKYAGKITESSQRMSQLIQNVLEYSRLSQRTEAIRETDLIKVLESVKIDYELIIRETGADIQSDRLPVVEAIPFQMQQLFSNLISNAIKFAGKRPVIRISSAIVSGEKIKLRPAGSPKQQYAEIRFADNGIGFEQEYAERIFKLFHRLHTRSEFTGTGIGLSIVAKIIKNHNGYIQAEAEKGQGAVFTVWLPVKAREDGN